MGALLAAADSVAVASAVAARVVAEKVAKQRGARAVAVVAATAH